jgi:hypothetical protein
MALTWIEDIDSRQATISRLGRRATSSRTRSWKVFGTSDDDIVHQEANAKILIAEQFWEHPDPPNVKLRAEYYTVSYLGDDAWQVVGTYERNGGDDEGDPLRRSRSFDTTGATQHITQAYPVGAGSTLDFEKRFPSTATNMSGAIGVDSNGVNGVDVVTPQFQWQETYEVPSTYVTGPYIVGVSTVTGTTNNASFRGFAAGEVLFLGCSGSQDWDESKGDGPWSLSYRFVATKNVTNQTVGSITGISKKGHEYLWVRYEDSIDSNALLKKPKAVYVNSVYRESDFSALGIGVG